MHAIIVCTQYPKWLETPLHTGIKVCSGYKKTHSNLVLASPPPPPPISRSLPLWELGGYLALQALVALNLNKLTTYSNYLAVAMDSVLTILLYLLILKSSGKHFLNKMTAIANIIATNAGVDVIASRAVLSKVRSSVRNVFYNS